MPNNIVDNPIINDPFEEPTGYWVFTEGQPYQEPGRRPAGYYFAPRTRARAGAIVTEEFISLDTVNEIRGRVREWRKGGYRGTTRITQELLQYWNRRPPERERQLFFCQREAAETTIWLVEAPPAERVGLEIPLDEPTNPESKAKGYGPLRRHACKMATGSGKTVVMGMLIAWSVLNKLHNPQDRRFSDAVLVVCPNLTVKERLAVLYPNRPGNYYEAFDLVPRSLLKLLGEGKYVITNWQALAPKEEPKRSVVKRGRESDRAFCNRILRDLGGKENLLVFNDEAHHAYRPPEPEARQETLIEFQEELEEVEEAALEATVWVEGLDRINAVRRINFCADLSATPFYIKGSSHPEGMPFPWIVSDFGLVDAIECGIVKIPRIPVDDNSGRPIPDYFHLWKTIMDRLPASERGTAKRKAKPEAVLRHAEGALAILAGEWKKTLDRFAADAYPVPPVMIVVCQNTDLSEVLAEHIGKAGKVLPDLKNLNGQERTLRIDSKLLEEAESFVEGSTREEVGEILRRKVATVGKIGEPGERLRCVVSVGMLTEGWDAQNVTQILGLRAFTSQLLCEQVVGRGLRRTNYDELNVPEYVDVYGVPFEVIPVKKTSPGRGEVVKPSTLVRSLPERKHLEITFPRVEGFIFDVRHRIKADIDSIPGIHIDPEREPTVVEAKGAVGYRLGRPDRLGPGPSVIQDRNLFHATKRLQASVFETAKEVTNHLHIDSRRFLFPQVLEIVWQYIERRVTFRQDAPLEEIALRRYLDVIVERVATAIEPDTDAGEPPLLPRIEKYRPRGSSSEVLFRTVRMCHGTTRSHVSHVVEQSRWEHTVAFYLEHAEAVVAYAKNDHLDFTIPYDFEGVRHNYLPDYLVRLRKADETELNIILEVKGYESEQDRAKEAAARRWVRAVNHHGGFGRWQLVVCKDPRELPAMLEDLYRTRLRAGAD